MPTYQYACTECGDRTEVVQKFSDDPLTVCSVCGGRLRKVFAPVGIVFKGSGFYRTDSRSGNGAMAGKDKDKSEPAKSPADSSSSSGSGDGSGSGSGPGDKVPAGKKPAASSSSSSSSAGSSGTAGEKVA